MARHPAIVPRFFDVRIDDATVFYVNSSVDDDDASVGDGFCETVEGVCSLRAAVQESNAAFPDERFIILESLQYALDSAEAPIAEDDTIVGNEDELLILPISRLLENDIASGTKLEVFDLPTTTDSGAQITDNGDGTLTYDPPDDVFGPAVDQFRYTISNGGAIDRAVVTIDLIPTNDPPIGNDDFFAVDKDSISFLDVLFNDSNGVGEDGLPGQTIEVVSVSGVSPGSTVTIDPLGGLIYSPPTDFVGFDSFFYTVQDQDGATDTALVTVQVVDGIDPPQTNPDLVETDEDTPVTFPVALLLGNDTDDGNIINFAGISASGSSGQVVDNLDGTITYTPGADVFGDAADTLTYFISDGFNPVVVGTVTIDIQPVNDPPVASDDAFNVNRDASAVTLQVLLNDAAGPMESEAFSIVSVDSISGDGVVDIAPGGQSLAYTPMAGFTGQETFNYTIEDAGGLSASAMVTVTVAEPNALVEVGFVALSSTPGPANISSFLPPSIIDVINFGDTISSRCGQGEILLIG